MIKINICDIEIDLILGIRRHCVFSNSPPSDLVLLFPSVCLFPLLFSSIPLDFLFILAFYSLSASSSNCGTPCIVGIVFGIVIIIALVFIAVFFYRRKRKVNARKGRLCILEEGGKPEYPEMMPGPGMEPGTIVVVVEASAPLPHPCLPWNLFVYEQKWFENIVCDNLQWFDSSKIVPKSNEKNCGIVWVALVEVVVL